MHANLFDIRWSQFYAFIASVPDGSAKNRLWLRFWGFPKSSCRISELNSLGYSCLARSACHKGLEKLFTHSGHVHIELERGNEGCYTSAAQRNKIFRFVLLPQLNPRWRMKLTFWLFMERANLQKCLFCFCVTAKYSARTLLHSDLRWKKIMLIESLGRHKDFLGNNCLQPSRNCVEML